MCKGYIDLYIRNRKIGKEIYALRFFESLYPADIRRIKESNYVSENTWIDASEKLFGKKYIEDYKALWEQFNIMDCKSDYSKFMSMCSDLRRKIVKETPFYFQGIYIIQQAYFTALELLAIFITSSLLVWFILA